MQQNDAATDSGVYYLVPNKHGGSGRRGARRHHPAPTETVQHDNFDETTQGGMTTRGVRSEWDGRKMGSDIMGSASPLDDDFDAITYTAPLRPESVNRHHYPQPPQPPLRPSKNALQARRSDENSGTRQFDKSTTTATKYSGFDAYGEYGQYINDVEQLFGGSSDPKRMTKPAVQDYQRTTETYHAAKPPNTQVNVYSPRAQQAPHEGGRDWIGKPSRLGSHVKNYDVNGPKPGQTYEMVDRRILEDGPVRTVTISKWREQVAKEAEGGPVKDIEFYGLEDYRDDRKEGEVVEIDPNTNRSRKALPEAKRTLESKSSPVSNTVVEPARASPEQRYVPSGRKSSSGHTYHSHSRSDDVKAQSQLVERTNSGQSWNRSIPALPTPERETLRHEDHSPLMSPKTIDDAYDTVMMPRSSTPLRRHPSPPLIHTPPRSPTPIRNRTPPSLFLHTHSGSTNSIVKSNSPFGIDRILASCDPPLLHLAPILGKLGIVTESHLRAIARLTDETRNREIREEALRQGVTVMEWAILLDRLHSLST